MSDGQLALRVDSVEYYLKELSYQALKTERELFRLSVEMREFKDEMREFKDEMREFKDEMQGFKDEMREFKDEMQGFKDEMQGFKNEMQGFKNEMQGFKDESERDRRELNRKWGELANKMGTLVEDVVAPNLPRVARESLGCSEMELFAVRMRRRRGSETLELDALVICPELVLINETKSRLTPADVDGLTAKLEAFAAFFPEYGMRRSVGILASLYVDESVVQYATRRRVLAMGMGDTTMEVLNPEAASVD
jgi:archaellum component FlaC